MSYIRCAGCRTWVETTEEEFDSDMLCPDCAKQIIPPSFDGVKPLKRIAYISDIHLDHYGNPWAALDEMMESVEFYGADWLIIPGDLSDIKLASEYLAYIAGRLNGMEIFYVCGNHEFYGNHIDNIHDFKNKITPKNLHVMNRGFYHDGESDILVVGSVGWIDGSWGNPYGKRFYKERYNDFRMIKGFDRFGREYGQADQRAMDRLLSNKARHKIAITHMLPNMECINQKYLGDQLNHCYANNWDLHKKHSVDTWFFGHSHIDFSQKIDGTVFLSNPAGYPSAGGHSLKVKIHEII